MPRTPLTSAYLPNAYTVAKKLRRYAQIGEVPERRRIMELAADMLESRPPSVLAERRACAAIAGQYDTEVADGIRAEILARGKK